MNHGDKKIIIDRMIMRVETGLFFIKDKFVDEPRRKNSNSPDGAWIRNAYILFSFYFELLLKAALILETPFENKNKLIIKLKKLGHNIEAICNTIKNIHNIGIEKFSFKEEEYKIITFNKTIYIKDFTDIRYDFLEGKIRNLPVNENAIIEESIEGSYEILNKIKEVLNNGM